MAVTIIKEDGTGIANANSYATLAEAETYLEQTGRKSTGAWNTAGTDAKSAALISGTDYMDQRNRKRYKGTRFSSAQRLEWPREGVSDELDLLLDATAIPEAIGLAAIEYAFEGVGSSLTPTPVYDDTGREIKSKFEKVDVLEERTVYQDGKPRAFRKYPAADLVLRRWLNRGAFGLTVRI